MGQQKRRFSRFRLDRFRLDLSPPHQPSQRVAIHCQTEATVTSLENFVAVLTPVPLELQAMEVGSYVEITMDFVGNRIRFKN